MGEPKNHIPWRIVFAGILLLTSCNPPDQPEAGTWTGEVQGKTVRAQWVPRSPRIGDRVDLRLRGDVPVLQEELRGDYESLEGEDGERRYQVLIRKPGPMNLPGWPDMLWTVPEEKKFPGGWVSLAPAEALPGNLIPVWYILSASLVLIFFPGFLVVRWLRKKAPEGRERAGEEGNPVEELEAAKAQLHHLTREQISPLISLLDRCWQIPPRESLEKAWFASEETTWEFLEDRFRGRREMALYAGEFQGWEVWEEEVDTALFRLRGRRV